MSRIFEKPLNATIGSERYQSRITWRNGSLIADDTVNNGGKDSGPDPYTLLLSSFAASTLIAIRKYIDRKGWDVPEIALEANMYWDDAGTSSKTYLQCELLFKNEMRDGQKYQLQQIARRCSISRILEGEIQVHVG